MTAKFELFKDTAGQFRFHLKAANGEIIAASQGLHLEGCGAEWNCVHQSQCGNSRHRGPDLTRRAEREDSPPTRRR